MDLDVDGVHVEAWWGWEPGSCPSCPGQGYLWVNVGRRCTRERGGYEPLLDEVDLSAVRRLAGALARPSAISGV